MNGTRRGRRARVVHGFARQFVHRRIVAQHHDRPPQRRPFCQAIDPRHRVPVLRVGTRKRRQRLVQIGRADIIHRGEPRRHPRQAKLGVHDAAGQAHPAQRGAEQVRVLLAGAGDNLPRGQEQPERPHEVPERTVPVMVLAMHVGGDGPADGDELRAGRGRQEPAPRQEVANDFGQRHAGLTAEPAIGLVESQKQVAGGEVQDAPAGI